MAVLYIDPENKKIKSLKMRLKVCDPIQNRFLNLQMRQFFADLFVRIGASRDNDPSAPIGKEVWFLEKLGLMYVHCICQAPC